MTKGVLLCWNCAKALEGVVRCIIQDSRNAVAIKQYTKPTKQPNRSREKRINRRARRVFWCESGRCPSYLILGGMVASSFAAGRRERKRGAVSAGEEVGRGHGFAAYQRHSFLTSPCPLWVSPGGPWHQRINW